MAIFRRWSVVHTLSPVHSERAWYWRHTLAQSQRSGTKRSILFSVSNLGFSDGIWVWTICTRCQVCIKTSNMSAVVIARLWLVTPAMVERGQAGDVHWWVLPREIIRVCVLWRCALSHPLPSLFCGFWEVGSSVNREWVPGSTLLMHTGHWWGFGTL